MRLRRVAALVGLAAIASACRDVAPAFGPTIPAARTNAEGLFGGVAQRFTSVQRDRKFAGARGKLGRMARPLRGAMRIAPAAAALGATTERSWPRRCSIQPAC